MSGNNQQHLTVPTAAAARPGSRGEEASSAVAGGDRPRSASSISQSQVQLAQQHVEAIDYSRQPSIRIERQSSRQNLSANADSTASDGGGGGGGYFSSFHNPIGGRNRSSSDPLRRVVNTPTNVVTPGAGRNLGYMPEIVEGAATSGENSRRGEDDITPVSDDAGNGNPSGGLNVPPLRHARTSIGVKKSQNNLDGEYEHSMVDFLDVMDPEVSTLTTLTNVQNSLFVPDLGRYINRRPTYILSRRPDDVESRSSTDSDEEGDARAGLEVRAASELRPPQRPTAERTTTNHTLNTITSRVNERYFAVLPHGVRLDGWTEEEKLEMNDHVRHMMHSKRSKFRRSMRGFGLYVRKPLGFFVTLYATLITLFGLAWVLFLIGWVNVGGKQLYVIHIIDSVLVALFAIVGDGLAPFRAIDTYHMCYIAHYHHLTWRLRREQSLPKLENKSDLPSTLPPSTSASDPEKASPSAPLPSARTNEFSVLTPAQQKSLEHHQKKFSKSHSFYKPHETSTHHAFPLRLLVAVVVLLDCHSLLQISLGACTWGISYHVRPFALTTVILCCSITVNITAGVLISVGDKRSRKKDVVERMSRQALTEEAMGKVERRRVREEERRKKREEELLGEKNVEGRDREGGKGGMIGEELEGRRSMQVEGSASATASVSESRRTSMNLPRKPVGGEVSREKDEEDGKAVG